MTNDGHCSCVAPLAWRVCKILGLEFQTLDHSIDCEGSAWIKAAFICPYCSGMIEREGEFEVLFEEMR